MMKTNIFFLPVRSRRLIFGFDSRSLLTSQNQEELILCKELAPLADGDQREGMFPVSRHLG